MLAVGARLHGVLSGHDEDRGVRVANTGGQWLYVIPSISLTTRYGTSYFVQLQVPLHQRVSGGQLVSNYAFTSGVSFDLTRPGRVSEIVAANPGTVAAPVSQAPVISRGEEVDLEAHVVAGNLTVFEFYADWCHVCRTIEPALGGLVADTGAALRRINIGNGQTDVTKQYGVTATPHSRALRALTRVNGGAGSRECKGRPSERAALDSAYRARRSGPPRLPRSSCPPPTRRAPAQ